MKRAKRAGVFVGGWGVEFFTFWLANVALRNTYTLPEKSFQGYFEQPPQHDLTENPPKRWPCPYSA